MRFWTTLTKDGTDERYRQAEHDGVTLTALPHQSYRARVGPHELTLGQCILTWKAEINLCHVNGKTTSVWIDRFNSREDALNALVAKKRDLDARRALR